MTDVQAPEGGEVRQPGGPMIRVLAQYVRDLSFENPRAPDSLRTEGKPEIDMGVEMGAKGRADGLFEVELVLSIKATSQGEALFQVELVYGGIFQLQGVPEPMLEPMLLIEAPRHLFPFARQIVASCTSDGGFYPPFLLEPIDFAAIYQQRQQQSAGGPVGQA